MGVIWAKYFKDVDVELEREYTCLSTLLSQMTPDELLTYALEDMEIYEVCKNHNDLRYSCIVAAVKRYNIEKFFYEEVANRSADFMILLDTFVQIQAAIENQQAEKTQCVYLPCVRYRKKNRGRDAAKKEEKHK
ncbi:uncharacterized protein LOC123006699 [Tribolium madens]|uniref:uncharacterized protein LOC123006699 n=1 Tax=Tribolium madens TaxID=41895 RepID=UPI001CF72875|nr:uncharacterized protein LOC123006699 [Tribolium madens]